MSELDKVHRCGAIEEALDAARKATGSTLLVLVSPRQAERLYLAMKIADAVVLAESVGHDTGIQKRVRDRYAKLSKKVVPKGKKP